MNPHGYSLEFDCPKNLWFVAHDGVMIYCNFGNNTREHHAEFMRAMMERDPDYSDEPAR